MLKKVVRKKVAAPVMVRTAFFVSLLVSLAAAAKIFAVKGGTSIHPGMTALSARLPDPARLFYLRFSFPEAVMP